MVKGAVQYALKTAEQARAPSARRTCGSVAILFSAMSRAYGAVTCDGWISHRAAFSAMSRAYGAVTCEGWISHSATPGTATMCRERIAVTAEQCVRFGRHFLQTLVKAEARVLT